MASATTTGTHRSHSPSSSEPVTSYEAQAYIVMYKGGKPEGETKAFDARELKTNLDPLVVRPEKK